MARSWLACSSTAVQLGSLSLDRVEHRAPQHFGFDSTLDQVVLRSGGNRRHPEVLVVEPGEDDDRSVGVGLLDAFQSGDPVGVWQVEVQQHAVRVSEPQFAFCIRNRLCPCAVDLGRGVGDQFFHQQRVGAVIFYKQHRQPTAGYCADRCGVRCRHNLSLRWRAHG